MFRVLLITVVSITMLGACTQHSNNDYGRGSGYQHGGGGPAFSSRILP
jgi:hypothetical protein